MRLLFYLLIFCSVNIASAQNPTIGLIHYTDEVTAGYTLVAPYGSNETYLIDECGFIVNQWTCEGYVNNSIYLLEDGSLLRPSKNVNSFESSTETIIERKSWDDDLLWRYVTSDENGLQHHDIELLPNGNILFIKFQHYEDSLLVELGRDPNTLGFTEPEILQIKEVMPTGLNTGDIVWQWNIIDHLVQNFDATKQNYGELSEHPQLMNINYNLNLLVGMEDWMHINGIEYLADRDQILLSSRHTSELYIIDHSTTTEQAATNIGGNSGKGGDFLWRWGNPQVYGIGDNSIRQLWGQHDPKLIQEGYPYEGMISVFNNGDQRGSYSSVSILNPVLEADGNYETLNDGTYSPESLSFNWEGEVLDTVFYSQYGSGFQILPNGNMMICESRRGRFFELKPDGTPVWAYQNPEGTFIWDQYTPAFWGLGLFRSEKYLPNYSAFLNRELNPMATIESTNILSENCSFNNIVSTQSFQNNIEFALTNNRLTIKGEPIKTIEIYNLLGELITQNHTNSVIVNAHNQIVIVKYKLLNGSIQTKKLSTFH